MPVPLMEDRPFLQDNRQLAEQRLESTERKLMKDEAVATPYQRVTDYYLEKEYVCKLPPDEAKPNSNWLLPHFPVVRPEKETTKFLIEFDVSCRN